MKEVENANNANVDLDEEQRKKAEYENGSPAKKVTIILGESQLDSEYLSEAKKLAENYEKLYDDANKADATPEEKERFAATAVLMQNHLKNCLSSINKNNPNSFSRDPNVANLYTAYAVNSHATVKALEESGVDVFNSLIRNAHEETGKHKIPQNEAEERLAENSIARLMYLAHLKYEYEHVTGNEAEKKAWRAEIMTELISDKFEDNINKFKENSLCKEVIKHHKELVNEYKSGKMKQEEFPEVNAVIYQAFHNKADNNYQSIYPLVYNGIQYKGGIKDPKEIEKVTNAVNEIDMMKGLYRNVFEGSTGNLPTDIDRDPVFDTLYMKRGSQLNGQQVNYAKRIKDKAKQIEEYQKDKKDRVDRYKNEYLDDIKRREESIGNKVVMDYIAEYAEIPRSIKNLKMMISMEESKLKSINNDYWAIKERGYIHKFKDKYKDMEPFNKAVKNALAKDMKKQGNKPVNEAAAEEMKIIKGYNDSIAQLEKRRDEVKGYLKNYNVNEDTIDDRAEKLLEYRKVTSTYTKELKKREADALRHAVGNYRHNQKAGERLRTEVENESFQYEMALRNDDKEKLKSIKEQREKRDEERKKEDKSAFQCVNQNNKISYISRNSDDTARNIRNEYKDYKTIIQKNFNEDFDKAIREIMEYPDEKAPNSPKKDHEEEIQRTINSYKENHDEFFERSLQEYEEHDRKNYTEPVVSKPDRSNNVIPKYKIEVVPEMAITELDMNNVQVDLDILKPEAGGNVNAGAVNDEFGLNHYIVSAYDKVEESAFTFRQGSPEYKIIQDGLRDMKKYISGKNPDMKTMIVKCRKMLAAMDQYIDRKDDELDAAPAKGENKNSRKRRNHVGSARADITQGLYLLEAKMGLADKDFTLQDVSCQLEFSAKLKKVSDPAVDDIIDVLKKGNRLEAQKKMQDYLEKRVFNYKTEDGYTFKFREGDLEGKRIPKDKDERMFAIMLKGYEKVVNSNIAYYQHEDITKLPKVIESVEHYNFKERIDRSINDIFGLNISTADKTPVYSLKKTDNALDYAKQFDENYKTRLSMFTNDVFRNGVKTGNFKPDTFVTDELSKSLVDFAFSNLYLKAVHENASKPFDFDKVDLDRRKMLTVIHSTPIVDNIGNAMKELFTINGTAERSHSEIHEIMGMNRHMVKDPASFNKAIVSSAIKKTAEDALKSVTDMMSAKNYNKNELKSKLELLDLTTKIAREIGMTGVLDDINRNNVIPNKGASFNDTLKKIQTKINERNVKKQVEPAAKVAEIRR